MIWRNFWLKRPVRDTAIQFLWQNQNHYEFVSIIAVVLATVVISFEKCLDCFGPKRSPRGVTPI